jgi:nitronate monooxygenase
MFGWEITSALSPDDGPWVANLITHSTNARLVDDLKLVAEYKPPIVITALGSPKPVMETVKSYGGLVFADVVNLSLARKAAEAGVDGMACICAGAGGHTGHLSPFAFISAVREYFGGYITVGGGIADGAGIAGAIAAGADFVYMGTRFLPTIESRAQPAYKPMIIDSDADDLVVSAAVTGTPASWLKMSLAAAGRDPNNLGAAVVRDYSGDVAKRWRDIWAAGQGVGRAHAIEPVAHVVDELEREYAAAIARFKQITR